MFKVLYVVFSFTVHTSKRTRKYDQPHALEVINVEKEEYPHDAFDSDNVIIAR